MEEWRHGILKEFVVDGIVLDDATVALGGSLWRVFLRVKIRTHDNLLGLLPRVASFCFVPVTLLHSN